MKKPYPEDAPQVFGWKRQRTRHGWELYHYPSDLARQLWLYPFSIGRARMLPGAVSAHQMRDFYLIHFVLRGEVSFEVRNRSHIARRGDVYLVDNREPFRHRTHAVAPAISYWLTLDGKDMPRYFSLLRADSEPVFSGIAAAAAHKLFRDLVRMTAHESPDYEPRADGLLRLLLAELYAVRVQEQPMVSLDGSGREYSEPVRKGIDWIVRYYDLGYSLKQLCEHVGCERCAFTRLFRKETGVPPVVWLNRYRIEQAKRLLIHTDRSVAEIARVIGLADQNYFARIFRSLTGQTPTRYRRHSKKC